MDRICQKIVSLPTNANRDLVANSLKQLLIGEQIIKKGDNDSSKNDCDNNKKKVVTPFMVACDKSQPVCLQYFIELLSKTTKDQFIGLKKLLGRPLDASPDHNNQAVHYAIMAYSPEMVIDIAKITGLYNSKDLHDKHSATQESMFKNLVTVLSQKNSNGDTAIMIASFLGKSTMLEMWFDQLFSSAQSEAITWEQCIIELRKITKIKNKGGDCCLSLGYGHGHVNVVDCLIQERKAWGSETNKSEGLVLVTHEDVEQAKALMEKVKKMPSLIANIGMTEDQVLELEQKIQDTRRCLIMMQVSSAKLADKRSAELLNSETKEQHDTKKIQKRKKRKPKKKDVTNNLNDEEIIEESKVKKRDDVKSPTPLALSMFKTLDDGTIVSRNQEDVEVHQQQQQLQQKIREKDHDTMQIMLRDRCLQSSNSNESTRAKSEAIMESLCLDASMLLLSPHGMAMELSPSQLDSIETVLFQQIDTVAEARQIHQRLMTQMKKDRKEENK